MNRDVLSHRWLALSAAAVGAFLTVALQQAGQLLAGRNPLFYLRTQFWHDQLGYLAISADAANGNLDLTEPVTMTGVNHYPRLYYSVVGLLARVLGIPTVVSWNLLSFGLQFAAALTVGLVAAHLSKRWWVGLLAPAPFFTGVFAYLVTPGAWYSQLEAHAVLWGPFGVLFSNNAETAGLCVGIIAIGALVWAWSTKLPRWALVTITLVASASVGMLSSFQTYSFLTMTYLLTFGAAAAGIRLSRRPVRMLIISGALVGVVFLAGPLLADRVGQLPTLMFGLLPAFPGLVTAIVRSRGLVALAGVAAVAAAAPQVIFTLGGMISGDPFLSYRVASNHQLGIVSWEALWGASVVLLALGVAFVLGLRAADTLTIAVSGSALSALPFLALNDVWGANAEPYRFWIEGILLGGILALLSLARVAGLLFPRRKLDEPDIVKDSSAAPRRVDRRVLATGVLVVGLLWVGALPDWVNSLRDPTMQAVWSPQSERESAINEMARSASIDPSDGLLTTELCIDNRTTKVTAGSPIANYHLGMAWPANREAIDAIITARDARELDFTAMAESDTQWVLTDSNCDSGWQTEYASELTMVASADYSLAPGEVISAGSQGDGVITLWQVAAGR